MTIRSYPKIFQLGHSATLDILKHPVVVEEKVDGSQFSFGVSDTGEVMCRSKGQQLFVDAPNKLFEGAVRTVVDLAPKLMPGWTYRAEVLAKPKHNTICYDRVPYGNLIVYDIDRGMEDFMTPPEKYAESCRIGLETVPVYYVHDVVTVEQIKTLMDRKSCLGDVQVEGVVVKAYGVFGKDGKTLMAKLVREDFKEMNGENWKVNVKKPGRDVKFEIASKLRTDARWEKAVQRLRDEGGLHGEPRDIGPLLRVLHDDLETEAADFVKEALYKWARKDIINMATRGFPEWYKNKLLEQVEAS